MKKILVFLCAMVLVITLFGVASAAPILITSSSDPALEGSTVLDFDTEALGTFSSRTFGGAVTFSGSQDMRVASTYSGLYGMSGRYLDNNPHGTYGNVTIDFVEDVSAFGMSWGAANYSWTINLYNDVSGFLGSLTTNSSQFGSPYIAFIGGTDPTDSISYATIIPSSSDWILIDNFEYVTASAPVPEPASMLLLGTGLIGLSQFRRKVKK